jgi:hypothetical protein
MPPKPGKICIFVKDEEKLTDVWVSPEGTRTDVRVQAVRDAMELISDFRDKPNKQVLELYTPDRGRALIDGKENIMEKVYDTHRQKPLIYGRKTTKCRRFSTTVILLLALALAVAAGYCQWMMSRRNGMTIMYFERP